MKILLGFLFTISLLADSCYTVQITSAFNTTQNYETLQKSHYPKGCKLMEIGKSLTVRCGCNEKYIDAKETLSTLQNSYKEAYITTTYRSRFEPTIAEKVTDIETKESNVTVLQKEKTSDVTNKEIAPLVAKQETVIIQTPKKKSKDKKIKAKKKKKSKKKKYRKKTAQTYSYSRYLNKLESKDGIGPYDYRYKFGAQLSYDLAHIDEAENSYSVTDWRRVRVSHSGSFFDEKLFYELEYSFTGPNHYKDIYIGYKDKIKPLDLKYRVKFGNIKIPFSLEGYSSSKNITFMERALTDGYADNRKLGGELLLSKKIANNTLNLFTSVFSNSIDENIESEVDKPGQAIRITDTHKFRKQHLLSIGASFMNRDMKGEDVKFNQASESKFIQEKYVSVRIKDVDKQQKGNFESLYIYNNYSLQGEYTIVKVLASKDNYTFDAYYLEGSYFLIGKGRRYKTSNSTLGKIKPTKETALEFAFRYSYINLNDEGENSVNPENGGEQTDYTLGINWYVNSELKFMFNYIIAEPKGTDDYDGRLQIVQLRTLFAF